jgi:hypothetical protein
MMKKIKAYLVALWAMVMGWFAIFPTDLINLWNGMPDDIKMALGPHTAKVIGYIILAVAVGRTLHGLKTENVQLKQKLEDTSPPEGGNDGNSN